MKKFTPIVLESWTAYFGNEEQLRVNAKTGDIELWFRNPYYGDDFWVQDTISTLGKHNDDEKFFPIFK